MSKDSSANYYQDNKERLQKKLLKDIKVFLKKKKKKNDNMVVGNIKIYQKTENKSWLSIEKILSNAKRRLNIIIRKYFHLENLLFFDDVGLSEMRDIGKAYIKKVFSFGRKSFFRILEQILFYSMLGF